MGFSLPVPLVFLVPLCDPCLQSDTLRPTNDLVHRGLIDFLLRNSELLRRLERVIAAFDRVNLRRRLQPLDEWLNLFRSAERVARALYKQHRLTNMLEMFDTKFRWRAGRVKRITKKN